MSYEIVSVDLKDDKIDEELRSLLRKAFNMEEPLKKGHLYLNTFAKRSREQTLFLAAVENKKIIGCNGFLANDFEINNIVPNTEFTTNEVTSEKKSTIRGSAGINSISSNTIALLAPHNFLEGESIRFISDNGQLPDGLDHNRVYYAITSGVGTDEIKVAQTLNDALNSQQLSINDKGGITEVVSRVSDKCFEFLDAPIKRVASKDSPIAYSSILENEILVQTDWIIQAIQEIMEY